MWCALDMRTHHLLSKNLMLFDLLMGQEEKSSLIWISWPAVVSLKYMLVEDPPGFLTTFCCSCLGNV